MAKKKEIDKEEFEKLCYLQCTKQEICDFFSITDKTLERRLKEMYGVGFSEVFSKRRSGGKISLRRNLMQMSKHNASVAIFLAKNWLGMSDKYEGEEDKEKEGKMHIKIELEDGRKKD